MRNSIQVALLTITTLCSTGLTGLVVAREFGYAQPAVRETKTVGNWQQTAAGGRSLGTANAPATLVVFSDYQCPFCKQFNRRIDSLRHEFGSQLRVVVRHFPLESIHGEARDAAIAAECAADQGRFEAMDERLFASQDSLGIIPYAVLARRAGVVDTAAFSRCLLAPAAARRVSADVSAGEGLGITGTPTVLLNDKQYLRAPTVLQLERRITSLSK
jgi:NhaA family Na+:H+ antiporter